MTTAQPDDRDLPPYDPECAPSAPFPERARLACRTWVAQIQPNQPWPMGEHAEALVPGSSAQTG